ncbi:MAG: hypothetical protein HND52_04005 [Ignavibacteriae bacterium]|nr:hypothetical protein [Ignavibacteriota bacterium]NOG97120.1 hypothetical protein [Ignavibacteriota bacterium]
MNKQSITKNYRTLSFYILSFFLSINTITHAQMSHQELLDAISRKITSLQTQLNDIKSISTNKITSRVDNNELINGIQESIHNLGEKVEKITPDESNTNANEQRLLDHLSNMEGSLNKLVQIKLEEQSEKEILEQEIESFQIPEESQHNVSLGFGTNIVSRYVWRGGDFGDSPSIQPYIGVTYAGFELGTWASFPLSSSASGYNEHDLYLSYTLESELGSFGLLLTDFYYPNSGVDFSNWDGGGTGAHTLELSASYSGPFNFLAAYNVHNDPDKSFYMELGYSMNLADVPVDIFLGGTRGRSTWYGISTDKIEITNIGLKGSREIVFTNNFSLTLSASYIMNPYARKTFLVFGISI